MAKNSQLVRYANETDVKQSGKTFTPRELANFVSMRMLQTCKEVTNRSIRILEPSIGDGELLIAFLQHLKNRKAKSIEVTGYEIDAGLFEKVRTRLSSEFPEISANLFLGDFLSTYSGHREPDLFSKQENKEKFDFVISNPPYVRTQIIGAKRANDIASKFDLTGRVDLYQPFLVAMIAQLKEEGTLGVIVSNRFLTTKSGASTRRFLRESLLLDEIWDLGDTKIFNAAVLPALIFGKKKGGNNLELTPAFNSIYEIKIPTNQVELELFDAITKKEVTDFNCKSGKSYHINRGILDFKSLSLGGTWAVTNQDYIDWLQTVKKNTHHLFGAVAKVKVGVKTTADKVFIKSNWDALGRLKPELLYPLLTRNVACRYTRLNSPEESNSKQILYPYDLHSATRKPVDLNKFPKSKAYLEAHREILESRTYVIEAGRDWFEIWVPHQPSSWARKKLVFPDISEKPVFWLDTSGSIVSGECYWLVLNDNLDEDLLYLILGVANSSFVEKFYDMLFPNKLYSGKRRFISQYVEKFPIPDPESLISKRIIHLVKRVLDERIPTRRNSLEREVDELVSKSFGL